MLENQIATMITGLGGGARRAAADSAQVRVWAVFLLCLAFSALGVVLSFWLLGTLITGYRMWGFAMVIAITMLGVSYGAKYANADARVHFTPVDLIQYLGQGFLWPSTWPALADLLGVPKVESPVEGALLLYEVMRSALVA
jgi:hypothetical protein